MEKFLYVRINGLENPDCIDNRPVFTWSYENSGNRSLYQKSFSVKITDENGTVFEKKFRSNDMRFEYKGKLLELHSYNFELCAVLSDNSEVKAKKTFKTGLYGKKFADFGAKWITASKKYENRAISFRKSFEIKKDVKSAEIYVLSSSWQRVYLNGTALKSDAFLLPPNASLNERCVYVCYELESLKKGKNDIKILLGAGYNSNYVRFGWRWLKGKGMSCLLTLRYTDGTSENIVSDESFEIFDSKISYCDMYNGEVFDAGYSPSKLENAVEGSAPKGFCAAAEIPEIKVIKRIKPVNSFKFGSSVIYDFGENFCGLAKISLKAKSGHKIKLEFSELLTDEKTLNKHSNYKAKATDIYICKGGDREEYTPYFTYHGFRYAKVSGINKNVSEFEIEGLFLSADLKSESGFLCSDSTVNRIYENMMRSLRSNFVSIPTDCCMRGERTPCLMDSACVETAAIYNLNMDSFYNNWLENIIVAKDEIEDHGNPDWDGDRIRLTHDMITYLNDISIAEKYYLRLKKYALIFENKAKDNLWTDGFGDWCHPNTNNSWEGYHSCVEVVNSCLLYDVFIKMADIAKRLKKPVDEAHFSDIAMKVKKAFNERYVKPDGTVNKAKQTEQLMALYVNIIPEELKEKVLLKFEENISSSSHDLGIYGLLAAATVLPKFNKSDLLLEILNRPDYPSFLLTMSVGATSLWEQWSIEDGNMSSHNHAMFAGIGNAFQMGFAGIRPIKEGFKEFEIRPSLPKKLNFIKCKMETVSGVISAEITVNSAFTELKAEIPVNTSAFVYIPVKAKEFTLFDGEIRLSENKYSYENGFIKLKLGSGKYNLRAVNMMI